MILVDTNVVFSLLVSSVPWYGAARELYGRDSDWCTESHALVEISNVLSRYVRAREITAAQALALMNEADAQMRSRLIVVRYVEALRAALKYKVSAYDARFLVCANDLGARLVTEDVKLREAAPRLTQSLQEVLAARP